jgi:hypothetical protein
MSSRVKFFLVLILLGLGAGCGYAFGTYFSAPLGNGITDLSCPLKLTEILQSAKGNVYEITDPNYVEPDTQFLVTYSVNGDEITNPILLPIPTDLQDEQKDSASQYAGWKLFADIIPPQDRQMVSQYNVFTDGYSNTLAAVDQIKDNPSLWILEIDTADIMDKDSFMFTLIHEYAHLLTLNATQITPDREIVDDPYNLSLQESKAAACPNYFTGTGCSLPDSYMNAFYDQFWMKINPEWEKIDALQYAEDLKPYYESLYKFYLDHEDQFVDDYATTHPTEDIAESFAYFVFSTKPDGTSIKDKKMNFFYEYPELIELRRSILNNTCITIK